MAAKLRERLMCPLDELDEEIAKVMLIDNGSGREEIDLKPVPTKHEYNTGDGQVQFPGGKH